eukprot:jgi/Picsp_1/2314/NSC_05777-R1_hypothetical protein CHLNCDRAFT_58390 [Chlorella variabilis]
MIMSQNASAGTLYAKIGGICFLLGAGMEFFMIKTGFYEKVVEIEAERLEEVREDREKFLRDLEQYVEEKKNSSKGNRG